MTRTDYIIVYASVAILFFIFAMDAAGLW